MRTRAAFALAFVAAVSGLIALRDAGYLGGRHRGGPLRITLVSDTPPTVRLAARLSGKPVRVQNVRVRVRSPGLSLRGPRLLDGRPLEDAALRDRRTPLTLGLRARAPGTYYAFGLITDYRRGQRRYRDKEAQTLCLAVGRRRRCDPTYDGPGAARVAQVGGPSRYPGARVDARTATYSRRGTYDVAVTISNQTRSVIDVSRVALDPSPHMTGVGDGTFRLTPHGSHIVRLTLTAKKCGYATFRRLRADLDGKRRSIPLSLSLRLAC